MKNKLLTLNQCLFNAFHNYKLYDPQDEQQYWAVYEGYMRISLADRPLYGHIGSAQKAHRCVRGCKIKPGDEYYQYQFNSSRTDILKLCNGCMALVLYLMKIERKECYMYTHWDLEEKKPVRINE